MVVCKRVNEVGSVVVRGRTQGNGRKTRNRTGESQRHGIARCAVGKRNVCSIGGSVR